MRTVATLYVCMAFSLHAETPTPESIRSAAAKGVAAIQASQKGWFGKQSCYSCHQQLLPALAIQAARNHSIPFDEAVARVDEEKTLQILTSLPKAIEYQQIIDPAAGEGYQMMTAAELGVEPNLVTQIYARHIAQRQLPDGHWKTGDARPPQSFSEITATALAIRTISKYHHRSLEADTRARLGRATEWLRKVDPQSNEERTYRIYGLLWAGAGPDSVRQFATALQKTQADDGGWTAMDGRKSDVYATGQALTVLHDAGMPVSDPAWQKGLEYLLRAQKPDGTWHVVSRLNPPAALSPPYMETGYPYGHDQFVSTMAASWSVRALAAALPVTAPTSARVLPAVRAEPWVETAMFGTPEQLQALLDAGLDANAVTTSGKDTLLMTVQPDVTKTKMLLARGAQVNLRSQSRFSPLLVASIYPGSVPALRLLLEKGAEVNLPKGGGAPVFNASPLVYAAYAGNAEAIPLLVKAGVKLDQKQWLLGIFPAAPVTIPISFGDVETTKAFLDAGESPNFTDQDGFTLLYMAVIANRTDVARMLIERGARVDAVDPRGMTALLYAVSADYGDPTMVRLLLKAGADSKVKTKEGLNAVELARKYGHSYLFSDLTASR